MIRLSAGTAACLGITATRMDAYPTTAYLLSGKNCQMSCAFCPQGMGGNEALKRLGRVTWPEYDWPLVKEALVNAEQKKLERLCLQSVRHKDGIEMLLEQIADIRKATVLPLSLSAWIEDENEAAALFRAGVQRISIALDVINPQAYEQIKGGSQQAKLDLLLRCADLFPERMVTHLICGLGESEAEALQMIDRLVQVGITVALFAFVPLRGSKLADHQPPALDAYRRVQAGYHLIKNRIAAFDKFRFTEGRLVSYGLPKEELRIALSDGGAFRTSGCPGCNRPYYNERPGGLIYNYHHPLSEEETKEAFKTLNIKG